MLKEKTQKSLNILPSHLTSHISRLTIISILAFLSGCGTLSRIVIVKDPLSAKEHADLASIYEEKGEYDLAIKEGEEALRNDSGNLKALISLGNSHLQKGEHKKAEKYYKKAMKIDPKNGDLLNNMAMLYLSMGRLEEAEGLAKEAISTTSPHLGYYYDTLGRVYEKMGKEKEAKEAFDKSGELMKGSQ
ncbi:MAG: tetratricopeptide repeat protein [Deltaproteobacteria bacterium]|nr:tetratricopeptide repeat protein [Deltaproteobacteria bacterium]